MAIERRVMAELRRVRSAEVALADMYQSMRRGGAGDRLSFLVSLSRLEEKVNHLESLLNGIA